MTDMETRLEVFADMVKTAADIFLWHYDGEQRLIATNCPEGELLQTLFSISGCQDTAFELATASDIPALLMDSMTMVWLAAPYKVNGVVMGLYVLGPAFSSKVSEKNMLKTISDNAGPTGWKHELTKKLLELPIIQHTFMMQYGVMLHYAITGNKISTYDVQVAGAVTAQPSKEHEEHERKGHSSFAHEQMLFKAIETGNTEYQKPRQSVPVGVLSVGDPVRQAKNELIVYIALSTRAALRGGLPDETAYRLSDYYIQMVEEESVPAKIYQIGSAAFNDFIHRVHNHKLQKGRSREIQNCVSYIETHLNEKISFQELAQQLGYSRNYLSAKFKKEMEVNLNEYITQQKLERAKILLKSSDKSIYDISDTLQFSSSSYFGSLFRKYTGMSPAEYRKGSL